MRLKIQTREVFGRILHYPMCELSKFLACINKRKGMNHTISDNDLKRLIDLGFTIVQVPQFGGGDDL
jgi:hypothetical protein